MLNKLVNHLLLTSEQVFDFPTKLFRPNTLKHPLSIETYRTYGTNKNLYFSGRIPSKKKISKIDIRDSIWESFYNSFFSFNTEEVPSATVKITFLNQELTTKSDEEGYLSGKTPILDKIIPGEHELFHSLTDHSRIEELSFVQKCLVPHPTAKKDWGYQLYDYAKKLKQ